MQMFSSSTEKTPNVTTGFRPPCWSPSDGLQHDVSMLNALIFSDTFCQITGVQDIAHPRKFGTLFIYYPSMIFQLLVSIY